MAREECKYKTLTQLREAIMAGEIKPGSGRLILDSDYCCFYVGEECLYKGGGPRAVAEESLDMLGIPWGRP